MALAFATLARRVFSQKPGSRHSEMRLEITTPSTSAPLEFALSPDGRYIVFVASGDGPQRLWLRALDRPCCATDDGNRRSRLSLLVAPTTARIGFFASGKLQRVDIAGGPPEALADAPAGRGGAWNPRWDDPVCRVAGRSPLRVFPQGPASRRSSRGPSKDSSATAFLSFFPMAGTSSSLCRAVQQRRESIGARSMEENPAAWWRVTLPEPGRHRTGCSLFGRVYWWQRRLLPEQGEITGEPITVADPVGVDAGIYHGGFSVSADGRVAYRAGSERRQLTWFERDGKSVGTAGAPDDTGLFYPELSPDGSRVAVTRARVLQNNADVWLIDLARGGTATRLTFDPAFDYAPLWSPDGTRLAFRSNRKGIYDVYVKPSSGGRK